MPGSNITRLADGLGWPEGPAVLPDGRIIFVESYRGQVSVLEPGGRVRQHALVGGGPNAVLACDDGSLLVTQNGGMIGPWRSPDPRPPSIQRVSALGKVEVICTGLDGITFRAPNDLAFGPDGNLYFTDPGGEYDPVNKPDPGFLFVLRPDGTGRLLAELPPTFPNGIVVEADGNIVWVESYTKAVRRIAPHGGTIQDLCVLPQETVPDGLKVAANGDLYISGITNRGVDVVRPDGTYVERILVGSVPTNVLFVGRTLYVTDGGHLGLSPEPEMAGHLWSVDVEGTGGMTLFPGHIG